MKNNTYSIYQIQRFQIFHESLYLLLNNKLELCQAYISLGVLQKLKKSLHSYLSLVTPENFQTLHIQFLEHLQFEINNEKKLIIQNIQALNFYLRFHQIFSPISFQSLIHFRLMKLDNMLSSYHHVEDFYCLAQQKLQEFSKSLRCWAITTTYKDLLTWPNSEHKKAQWAFALQKLSKDGILKPDGTKLSRKDFPELLTHSFIILNQHIFALAGPNQYLGFEKYCTKLAEDEFGGNWAIKILIQNHFLNPKIIREETIAIDLQQALPGCKGIKALGPRVYKYYLPQIYLGKSLSEVLRSNTLNPTLRIELAIKLATRLHELHTGKLSQSQTRYIHGDLNQGNIVIDNHQQVHLIDFEDAEPFNTNYLATELEILCSHLIPITYPVNRPRLLTPDMLKTNPKPQYFLETYNASKKDSSALDFAVQLQALCHPH